MKHISSDIPVKSTSLHLLLSGARTCRFDQMMVISSRYFRKNDRYTDIKNVGMDYSRAKQIINRELDPVNG